MVNHQGFILKTAIKEAGLTQEEFAKKMGISRNYLLTLTDKTSINKKYLDKAREVLKLKDDVFTMSLHSDQPLMVNEPKEEYVSLKSLKEQIQKLKEEVQWLSKGCDSDHRLIILHDEMIKELKNTLVDVISTKNIIPPIQKKVAK